MPANLGQPEGRVRLVAWRSQLPSSVEPRADQLQRDRWPVLGPSQSSSAVCCTKAGGTEIDLEIGESPITGRLRMRGQVTASEWNLARAWVSTDGPSGRLEAEVDGLGQFSLDGLVSGVHRLDIGLASELIEIPSVDL